MMHRALVGAIDVEAGLEAVAEARALGAQELALVTVGRRDDDDRAWALLREIRARAAVDAELHVVHGRHPGRGLVEAARARAADVIVLGAPRPGQLHPLRGEAARAALYHAPCPVVVARGALAGAPVRAVAVGFDGSRSSRAAVRVAADLAEAHSTALTVVSAWTTPAVAGAGGPPPELVESEVQRLHEQVDALLAGLPPRTARRVIRGRPVGRLLEAAETVDLLVVGTGDCTAARRVLSGSVADALMREAACSVMVVPSPGADADADAPRAAAAEV